MQGLGREADRRDRGEAALGELLPGFEAGAAALVEDGTDLLQGSTQGGEIVERGILEPRSEPTKARETLSGNFPVVAGRVRGQCRDALVHQGLDSQ